MSATVRAAALLWGASILLSRVIGLVREAVIGRTLGVSLDADLYQAAFVFPDFLNYLLAGGALSVVLIPILVQHKEAGDHGALKESFAVLTGAIALAIGVLTLLLYLALPQLLAFWFPGFDDAAQLRLVAIARIVLPAQIFHVLGGVFSAALLAHDKHALPALAPLLYTVAIIVGGLLGGVSAGPIGFAWGVLVGSMLGPFGLPLVGVTRLGLWGASLRPRAHPDLVRYLKAALPIMLGFSIVMLDEWVFKRLASPMAAGSVAQMSYARTLMRVPMGVFGLAMGAAAFPTMSRLAARGDSEGLAQRTGEAVRKVLVLALGAQVLLSVVGQDIVQVIYGDRLSALDRSLIAQNLLWMCAALGAWSTHNLFARVFYAQRRTWIPSVVGTLCMLGSYPVYLELAGRMGTTGLAIAGALAMSSYVVTLAILATKSLGHSLRLGGFLLRTAPVTALLIWGAHALDLAGKSHTWLPGGLWAALVRGGVLGGLLLLIYGLCLYALGVPELVAVLRMLTRKLGPKLGPKASPN